MAFGQANVVTNSGKAIAAKRHIGATPAQAEPKFIGIGTGAQTADRTAAAADTALSTEVESRATGAMSNVTQTVTNDTVQIQGSITATAPRVVNEAATFDASTAGAIDLSSTFNPINLQTGDTLQLTFRKTFG
ncbi:MAG: hypothetical protein ACOZJZ_00025 [Pseudomonadota bacterium]